MATVGAVRGLAAEERADVGERAQDLLLAGEVGARRPAGRTGDQALDGAEVGVVAEHQAPCLLQALGARIDGGIRGGRQAREPHPAARRRRGAIFCRADGERRQQQERRAGADVGVPAREHLAHPAGTGRHHRRLHLHRLQHRQRVAGGHLVPLLDGERDDHRRGRRAHDLPALALDAMGDAVHLHDLPASLRGNGDAPAPLAEGHRASGAPRGAGRHLQAEPVHLDAEERAIETGDEEKIIVPAMAQLHRAADLLRHLGTAARRRGVEARAGGFELRLVAGDRRRHQGRLGAPAGEVVTARHQPVDPAGIHGLPRDQLGAVEDLGEEGLVRGAAA